MLIKTALIVAALATAQTIKNNSSFVHDLKLIEIVNHQPGFQIDALGPSSDWLISQSRRFNWSRVPHSHSPPYINLKPPLSVF